MDIRLNVIVMLLTSFRYRDMRDEVRVVLHEDVITRGGSFTTSSQITRCSVCTLNGRLCSMQDYSINGVIYFIKQLTLILT